MKNTACVPKSWIKWYQNVQRKDFLRSWLTLRIHLRTLILLSFHLSHMVWSDFICCCLAVVMLASCSWCRFKAHTWPRYILFVWIYCLKSMPWLGLYLICSYITSPEWIVRAPRWYLTQWNNSCNLW